MISFHQMQSLRKSSAAESCGSPPILQNGFFPHDLDDIYENHGDHQYFTHTGAARSQETRPTINSIFHRVGAAPIALEDYTQQHHQQQRHSLDQTDPGGFLRHRFDNSSFARSLSTNDDSGADGSPKEHKKTKDHHHHHHHNHHHNHHHHSIQELLKHFGKKVHIWPRKTHDAPSSVCTSPQNDPQKNFRMRSKSLDVNTLSRPNKILEDCGATYQIFDRIVKEGKSHNDRSKVKITTNLTGKHKYEKNKIEKFILNIWMLYTYYSFILSN